MNKKMNKKYMYSFLALFAMVFVSAGVYYVNTLTVTVDIGEPFDVIEYAILGDGSSYNENEHGYCLNDSVVWMTQEELEEALSSTANEYLDAGESRKICVKIHNDADVDIPYVVDFEVTGDGASGNSALCQAGFSDVLEGAPWIGNAIKEGVTIDGKVITVDSDAEPTEGCQITVKVGRGTA